MDATLHLISQVGILAGVFTAMLAIGIRVPFRQILESLRNPRPLALILLANFVAVPLLAVALARVLPVPADEKTALILLGATAGAPFLPKLAEMADGHVPFSIGLMVILMAVTVVYAPLVLPLLLPEVSVPAGDIARSLIAIMLLPLSLGLLARARYPRIAGWSVELNRISGAGMAIGLSAGLLVGWQDLLATVGQGIIIGTVLLGLGAADFGWLSSRAAEPDERRVAALGTGMRNFSAALLIAGRDFGSEVLVMTMAATIVLMVTLVIIAGELGRHERAEEEPADAGVAPSAAAQSQ